MPLTIEVRDETVTALLKNLKAIGASIPWPKIGEWGIRTLKTNIAEGGRPDKFQPLKAGGRYHAGYFIPSTLPLWDTGALRESINYQLGPQCVWLDSGLHYGYYQALGTTTIPARDYMQLPPESIDGESNSLVSMLNDIATKYIQSHTT